LARDVLFDESQEELAKLEAAGEEFEEVKPLAEELIDTLIDLLFFADFTLPRPQNTKNKVTYAIWQSGVGCNTSVGTTKEFESNRTEILRLLLTLTSQSMYMSANLLPVQGVKAISYIVTCPDKQVVLSTLCSLLNTVRAKSNVGNAPADTIRPSSTTLQVGRYRTMYRYSRTRSRYWSHMPCRWEMKQSCTKWRLTSAVFTRDPALPNTRNRSSSCEEECDTSH
jgi:hypothetical protein